MGLGRDSPGSTREKSAQLGALSSSRLTGSSPWVDHGASSIEKWTWRRARDQRGAALCTLHYPVAVVQGPPVTLWVCRGVGGYLWAVRGARYLHSRVVTGNPSVINKFNDDLFLLLLVTSKIHPFS